MRTVLFLLAGALAALPVTASIQALNLEETLELHSDVVHGTIVSRDTLVLDHPEAGSVYTLLTIEGESVLSGEKSTTQAVFMGSHDPADRFNHSEMPELKDVRTGNEVVVFSFRDERLGGRNLVYNLGGVFRVERGFGEPVVIGKGEGFAFPANVKLQDATRAVRETWALVEAKRAAALQPVTPNSGK
jgi:hypothetical protein